VQPRPKMPPRVPGTPMGKQPASTS
jgi:hypothetical protein